MCLAPSMGMGSWNADRSQRTAPFVERYPGYVVSYDGDCQRFRERETNEDDVPHRRFIPLGPADLDPGRLEDLWYMGIIVCPEEAVHPIAQKVTELAEGLGRDRVGLYLAPGVNETRVIKGWKKAGIGPPAGVYPFDHEEDPWRNLHKRFGNHHAEQLDQDLRRYPDKVEQYAKGDG